MGAPETHLCLLGCSHESAPLGLRERIALTEETHQSLFETLNAHPELRESLVLHTCNRLEVYAVGNGTTPDHLKATLCTVTGLDADLLSEHAYDLRDADVVKHLYGVASGLNSQLIGETEIFGQVKTAYEEAKMRGTAGPLLHKLMQKSFQAGKWARTNTSVSQGQVSLGNIAVDLAERVFGSLKKARALVVGSGDVGRDVAKALLSRGLKELTVTSRRLETAAKLATEVGGVPLSFDCWQRSLETTDIAIFATSAPGALLTAAQASAIMQLRGGDPLFLIDLAVPRDIEPEVGEVESVFLYNFEDLSEIANANRKLRESDVEKCREALDERAHQFWTRFKSNSRS